MKFGQNLWRNQVPEWAPNYINYKALKKLIKVASVSFERTGDADLAEIFFSLDRNLEDVDLFYNKKLSEYTRRLKLLHDRYGPLTHSLDGIDSDEYQDLITTLLEIRAQLRKLQWYGEVNRRGFDKILKKLDKKVPNVCAQQRYLTTKVLPTSFASNSEVANLTKAINDHLSAVGESKVVDDNASVHSLASVNSASTKTILTILSGLSGEKVAAFVKADDSDSLSAFLVQQPASDPTQAKLHVSILQKAISMRARKCTQYILSQLDSIEENDDISGRNCLHRLVVTICRTRQAQLQKEAQEVQSEPLGNGHHDKGKFINPAETPMVTSRRHNPIQQQSTHLLSRTDEPIQFLDFFLNNLKPSQRQSIYARDSYGRTPLHYAAEYGYVVICELILDRMKKWSQGDVSNDIASESWLDQDGLSPLHHAVIGGHPLATKILLDFEFDSQGSVAPDQVSKSKRMNELLLTATKADYGLIVRALLEVGVSPVFQDGGGECALHVAARHGRAELTRLLVTAARERDESIDVPEDTFGWTPLFIAAVDGNLDVLNVLIDAGADLVRMDLSGWTAKEHAALRGHIPIMRRLAELTPVLTSSITYASQSDSRPTDTKPSALHDRRSTRPKAQVKTVDSVKTFGHRYLTNESMILLSLGSMDTRKKIQAVTLDQIPLSNAYATQLDTALSLVVSATGATGEPTVFDLPEQENISTELVTFMAQDPAKTKIMFDIVPTYAGSNDRIVGRAVALINSIKPSIGSNRMTLQGDVSVPILATTDMNVIGTVHFNFLIITPFSHPNMNISEEHTYWKKVESTMLIGHRGLGKNVATRNSLQLGENTIQSFIAAANLGASYVEFDVQLTKDHVPVIYHDFLVSETGIDAPVHTLTLEQFLNISEGPTPRDRSPNHVEHSTARASTRDNEGANRPRAYSAGVHKNEMSQKEAKAMRMRHTRDFKIKGFKGNSRGDFIQDSFTTLEEMFRKVPQNTGFNIEMKYPMLHESVEHEMDPYAVELNSFVDTVLKMVYDLSNGRQIIFSSFNPDICLLLSFKQPSIPVLFLSDSGMEEVGDIRASSLQEAIRFANRCNLLGVVSAAEPLVTCPRLVRVVKESGLVCVTYGSLNNDPKNVSLQVQEGIDAVIVDSVLAIRKELTQGSADGGAVVGGGASGGTSTTSLDHDDGSQISEENGEAAEDKSLADGVGALVVTEVA